MLSVIKHARHVIHFQAVHHVVLDIISIQPMAHVTHVTHCALIVTRHNLASVPTGVLLGPYSILAVIPRKTNVPLVVRDISTPPTDVVRATYVRMVCTVLTAIYNAI